MTVVDDPRNPYRDQQRRNRAGKVRLEGLPPKDELDAQPHRGEAADRFSLYTPDQIEAETRTVRWDISFTDPIKVRDQMEMILACAREVIAVTRNHPLGSVRQRITARAEAASLGRALTRFNGKTPFGEYRRRKRRDAE